MYVVITSFEQLFVMARMWIDNQWLQVEGFDPVLEILVGTVCY